ncbi:FKBP-type peptidyl-prolyl cis-trans isomerase [Aliiglaciecola sp. CAU 1673]|uniref:FKBP-type peptidyl-prolyl cis-trans isomerase n=1 Tax=Aliiglaciecola sp. CAU 1673 TaxID=3032595 RepID=UPI0023DCD22C|nr:FKBP-type peptidyl-prolyl cis-trans isomerase [Aliiglaciecola sp. CAU 1673]MDF2179181.1 FKBP-type peptidyl-prolyl cis-trans isomerase [Aliiglaciecola sp. CAU 1673]
MSKTYSTVEAQASYGIGLQMGQQLAGNPFEGLDIEAVQDGLAAAFKGEASAVTNEQLRHAFNEIHQRMEAAKAEQFKQNIAQGESFLAENAKKEGVSVTDSGLQYEIIAEGEGDSPVHSSTVRTHYHGTLIDGTVFDSSYERGEPAEFPVGGVIKGWTEALQMMKPGSKWRLYVPHNLAYGERGAGGAIGPYSTLIFDVELLEILD